jgi:hypothetical protein
MGCCQRIKLLPQKNIFFSLENNWKQQNPRKAKHGKHTTTHSCDKTKLQHLVCEQEVALGLVGRIFQDGIQHLPRSESD